MLGGHVDSACDVREGGGPEEHEDHTPHVFLAHLCVCVCVCVGVCVYVCACVFLVVVVSVVTLVLWRQGWL